MGTPKTHAEWASLIANTKSSLPALQTSLYQAPPPTKIPRTIDHTLLALSATEAQVNSLCAEAREYVFATVCVRLNYVPLAVKNLQGSNVGVACVVGFHEGTHPTAEKVAEASDAVKHGASELDMVINYPWLKEDRYTDVYEDILAVRNAAPNHGDGAAGNGVLLKVILETSQLSKDEIIAGCVISCLAGADYVKTSTGFNGPGANVEDVALMRAVCEIVRKGVKVKASGGVRNLEDCLNMLRAGADRIGASAGVKIAKEVSGNTGSESTEAAVESAGAY